MQVEVPVNITNLNLCVWVKYLNVEKYSKIDVIKNIPNVKFFKTMHAVEEWIY